MTRKRKHVIIGASAAGVSCAQMLRRLLPYDEIELFWAEQADPYNKCLLVDVLSGYKRVSDITIFDQKQAADLRIFTYPDVRIESIYPDKRTIMDDKKRCYAYDTLTLATGSYPRVLPSLMDYASVENLFFFHTLTDVTRLTNWMITRRPKTAIVIGAGLTGLECADSLNQKGLSVTVIEQAAQLLDAYVDKHTAIFIEQTLLCGVHFIHNAIVVQIQIENNRIVHMRLSTGKLIMADMYIITVGTRAHNNLGERAGIAINKHDKTIIVDSFFRTNIPEIYAIGDVVQVPLRGTQVMTRSFLWPDAVIQGCHVAHTIANRSKPYPGMEQRLTTCLGQQKIHIYGWLFYQSLDPICQKNSGAYQALFMQKNSLKGFILIGKVDHAYQFEKMVRLG